MLRYLKIFSFFLLISSFVTLPIVVTSEETTAGFLTGSTIVSFCTEIALTATITFRAVVSTFEGSTATVAVPAVAICVEA